MAFPIVAATNTSSTNTAGTNHVVSLPTGISPGDLILICMDIGSTSATLNAHADYTELLDESAANGLKILYRWALGNETNPTFVSSASTRDATVSMRIRGAAYPPTQAPQIGTTATGTSTTPNPPASASPGATKDFLFVTFCGSAGEQADDGTYCTAFPTNYSTNNLQKTCGVAGTNLGGMIALATRSLNTGSAQDPGTFTVSENDAWRAQTIMVHPDGLSPFEPPVIEPRRASQTAGWSAACTATFFVNLALTLLAPAAAPVDIFPAPLYVPRIVAKQTQDTTFLNLLTNTLAPSAQDPFRQNDWPNPQVVRRPQPELTQNLRLTLLAPQIPPGQQSLAVPVLRKPPRIESQPLNLVPLQAPAEPVTTYVFNEAQSSRQIRSVARQQDLVPNLLENTLAPSAPVDTDNVFRSLLIARIIRPVHRQDQIPPNLLTSTLGTPNVKPFHQDDWPNPVLRVRSQEPFVVPNTALDLLDQVEYIQRVALVGSQAGRRVRTVTPFEFPNTIGLLTAQNVKPFHQDDWPNPITRPRFRESLVQSNLLVGPLAPIPPPSQTDWPNPRLASRFRESQIPPNLLTSTLAPVEVRPFAQLDWPNPIRPRRNPQFDHLNTIELVNQANPKPFHQDDWQNPVRRVYAAPVFTPPNVLVFGFPNPPRGRGHKKHFIGEIQSLGVQEESVILDASMGIT